LNRAERVADVDGADAAVLAGARGFQKSERPSATHLTTDQSDTFFTIYGRRTPVEVDASA
jgi:hypothetical protein